MHLHCCQNQCKLETGRNVSIFNFLSKLHYCALNINSYRCNVPFCTRRKERWIHRWNEGYLSTVHNSVLSEQNSVREPNSFNTYVSHDTPDWKFKNNEVTMHVYVISQIITFFFNNLFSSSLFQATVDQFSAWQSQSSHSTFLLAQMILQ